MLSKVDQSGECWVWTGYVQPNGYAKTTYQGKYQWAHRVAWQMEFGPIPDGLSVCHRCDNGLCVRPSHLFLGTQADNMADMRAKGRSAKGDRSGPARRVHPPTCPSGHLRSDYRNGKCLICNAARMRARRAVAA